MLGLVLGSEREFHGHPAGVRTMALIAAGACLFTAVGLDPAFANRTDPTRIAAQVVTGVGFLGAGAIIRQGRDIRGLTTAASIWVVASVGVAVGLGLYAAAGATTLLVLVVLIAIQPLEQRFLRRRKAQRGEEGPAPKPPAA